MRKYAILLFTFMCIAVPGFADLQCSVNTIAVPRAIVNGHWENTGDLTFTCVTGDALAISDASVVVSYPGTITNTPVIPSGYKITVTNLSGSLGAALDTAYSGTNSTGVNNAGALVVIKIPANASPAAGSFKLSNVLLSLAGSTTVGQSVSAVVSVSSSSGNVTLVGSPVTVISTVLPLIDSATNPPALAPGTEAARFTRTGGVPPPDAQCSTTACRNAHSKFAVTVTEDHMDAFRGFISYYSNGTGSENGTNILFTFSGMLPGSILYNCMLTSSGAGDIWQLTGNGIANSSGQMKFVAEAVLVGGGQLDTVTLTCGADINNPGYISGASSGNATGPITVSISPSPIGTALPGPGGTASTNGGTPRYAAGVSFGPITVVNFIDADPLPPEGGGPLGGSILALVANPASPGTLYAGTKGAGVFKTVDGGTSWTAANSGIRDKVINAVAVDPISPVTLYAGSTGAFKTTDGGMSWSAIGLTTSLINGLTVDPQSSSTVYAATSNGVFKTVDGGANWNAINSGLTDLYVIAIAIDPSTPAKVYAATSSGIARSSNGGANWTFSFLGTGMHALALDPVVPTTVYAVRDGYIFKSVNGAMSWANYSIGAPAGVVGASLAIHPTTTTTLYVGTTNGVYLSIDGGIQWSPASFGLPNDLVQALVLDQATPSTIYAGTPSGVFKSVDSASSWSMASTGLSNHSIQSLAIDPTTPSTVYAGTATGGVYKSTNGAASWVPMNSGLTRLSITALAIAPTTPVSIFAGTLTAGVFKSVNGGASWVSIGFATDSVRGLAVDPTAPATVYASLFNAGVQKSTNGGTSWLPANSGISSPFTSPVIVTSFAIDPGTPSTVFAGSNDGVFKTTNGGASWATTLYGVGGIGSLAVSGSPTRVYAGTIGGSSFKSITAGSSWTGLGVPANTAITIHPSVPNIIYASGNTVMKSTDGGATWNYAGTWLSPNITCLVIDPSSPETLYAGTTNRGVFKTIDGGDNWFHFGANTGNGALPAASISKLSGDGQSGNANSSLRYPLSVLVTNSAGIPVAGVTVDFSVTAGGGTLSGTQAVTDSQGLAFTHLTMGTGPNQTVTASTSGVSGSPVTFSALASQRRSGQIISQ